MSEVEKKVLDSARQKSDGLARTIQDAALAAPASGDLLVSSSVPGHAMRADKDVSAGTVIGKALEKLDENKETGVIEVVVMLR